MQIHDVFHIFFGFPNSSVIKESACNAGDPVQFLGLEKGIGYPLQYSWASPVAQLVKNLHAMWETWVWSLGWEDPWRREWLPSPVFWPEEFMDCIVHGVAKSQTRLSDFHFISLTGVDQGLNPCPQQ